MYDYVNWILVPDPHLFYLLLKGNGDFYVVLLQRLGGRMREFVALLASMFSLLLSCRHACLHICMDVVMVGKEVVNHIILHCPCEKIELSYGRGHSVEIHTGPTTEGIEHLLAVGLEMRLVGKVDYHMLPGLGDVGYIVHLGIVRDKPVEDPERNVGLVLQDIAEEV